MSFEISLHRARRYIAHTLRQTQRQIKRVARGKIKSVSQSRHSLQANKTFSFPYEVLCHCEALPTAMPWQSPGRAPYHKTHARYFCTCVEKKAHTSKRVSVIACDNAISKAKCAPWGKTIPPQLRWYCLLMCFRIKELWIVINVNFLARGDFRPVCRSTARRLPLSFRSPKSLQEGSRPHTDCTFRWLRVRASTGLSPAPVF